MTNEIKEILYLEDYINKYKGEEKAIINGNRLTTPAMLDYLEVKDLLDYITNLEEELEKTKLENKVLKEQMVAMVQPNYVYGIELQGEDNE